MVSVNILCYVMQAFYTCKKWVLTLIMLPLDVVSDLQAATTNDTDLVILIAAN
jgi:hypothetical protein